MSQSIQDRVPREDRAYTNNPPTSMNELLTHLRQVETRNYDLARRNGELLVALEEHAPAVAASLTPMNGHPTRYVLLSKIIDRAIALAQRADTDVLVYRELDDDLEALIEEVNQNQNYWIDVATQRQKKKNDYAQRIAKRKAQA